MKSKKKLLIAMAAMSVAAIGAGTVSTFAWYTASTAVTLSTANGPSFNVGTKDGDLALGGLTINVALNANTPVELTNSLGQVSGVLGDGTVATPIAPGVSNTVQAAYTAAIRFTTEPTNDQLQGLVNKTFLFEDAVEAEGNVKLIAVDDLDGDGVKADMTVQFGPTITIGTVDNGLCPVTAGVTVTFSLPNFVVRTNNEYGRECFLSAEASNPNYAKGQAITATSEPGSASRGDAYIYDSTSGQFYVHNGTAFIAGGFAHNKDVIKVVAKGPVTGS